MSFHNNNNSERRRLQILKKSLNAQQKQLNQQREELMLQKKAFAIEKQMFESELFESQQHNSELAFLYEEAITEIKILQRSESNYIRRLQNSKKEILNLKKRLKLAIKDMDRQSKYYEQQLKQRYKIKNKPSTNILPNIKFVNETSLRIVDKKKFLRQHIDAIRITARNKSRSKREISINITPSKTTNTTPLDECLSPGEALVVCVSQFSKKK